MITPKDKRWWRKAAILSYLKTHEGVDILEIVSYMNVRCDFTLSALKELEKERIVERCDILYVLKDSEESKGTQAEIAFAREHNILTIFEKDEKGKCRDIPYLKAYPEITKIINI